MPVLNWNQTIIDGKNYLVIDVAKFRIPLDFDPSSNMFIAVAAPDGGLGNFPALVKGDQGDSIDLDTSVNFAALAWDDATPDYASLTETSPGIFRLNLGLHKGAPGDDNVVVLDPADYGTPVAKRLLEVKTDLSGFQYVAPKVGDRFFPASIAAVPSGNAAYTVASVSVPAQLFDWRPHVEGQLIVAGTGTDVRTDLIARLDNASSGNIVGRCFAAASSERLTLSSGPPAGSADTYDKVLQGDTAVIYFRTERQSGGDTYTTSATTSRFCVEVRPIP